MSQLFASVGGTPAPMPAPTPPPAMPDPYGNDVQEARRLAAEQAGRRRGRQSTILSQRDGASTIAGEGYQGDSLGGR
jgi:hypothetical protein